MRHAQQVPYLRVATSRIGVLHVISAGHRRCTLHHMHPGTSSNPPLICLSHLRWNFVFQRPQHLMTRYARDRHVYFIEEPVYHDGPASSIAVESYGNVFVIVPQLPRHYSEDQRVGAQRLLLDHLIVSKRLSRFVLWYYTPMALPFSDHLSPAVTVYDCMDELSAFKDASDALPALERRLMQRADVVLTGGRSLYEAKQGHHANIHAVPSSVDVAHFATARSHLPEPLDQRCLERPRLGFFGVLDERLDIPLLAGLAAARPHWQFIMIGPIVKIDPADLPSRSNIHYLGAKSYRDLPAYIGGWDVALLLFARNESTRFISPTKTPEYLAAGTPVVSTSIRDVVDPYGDEGLVQIADSVPHFVAACERALTEPHAATRSRADQFLRTMSWDRTWQRTAALIDGVLDTPRTTRDLRKAISRPAPEGSQSCSTT